MSTLFRVCPPAILLTMALSGCQTGGSHAVSGGPVEAEPRKIDFPRSWTGVWEGVCTAERPDAWNKQFKMELYIRPTKHPDRWQWKLVYGEGAERSIRDYELVAVDAAAGRYRIDEKNSIVLDSYLIGTTLYSQFSLDESLLTTSYTRRGEKLLFEIVVSRLDQTVATGGEGDTPTVMAYPIKVAQRAELARVAGR